MGGRPLFALNLVAWPRDDLPLVPARRGPRGRRRDRGGGGFAVVGGHSVDDPEPKYGLAVVGEVAPGPDPAQHRPARRRRAGADQAARHRDHHHRDQGGAAPDDLVGRGRGVDDGEQRGRRRGPRSPPGPPAATDVTGFGLLGHLHEDGAASRVDAELDVAAVPVLPGVRALAEAGILPGGSGATATGWRRPSTPAATARSTCCCSPTPRPRAACCSARSRSGRGGGGGAGRRQGCRRR